MKGWVIRLGLVALAMAVVCVRAAPDRRIATDGPIAVRIHALLQSYGIASQLPADPHGTPQIVRFQTGDCRRSFVAVPFPLSGEIQPLLGDGILPPGRRMVFYADRAEAELDVARLRYEQLRLQALWTVGLGRYQPLGVAVLVIAPDACDMPRRVDWRRLWMPPGRVTSANG